MCASIVPSTTTFFSIPSESNVQNYSQTISLPKEISAYCPNATDVSLLCGGAVNTCYRVKTAKETFAVRLGKPNLENYGFDREREYKFYLEAEQLGLAPALKKFDLAKGLLVMNYIDGPLVDDSLVRQQNIIPLIAEILQKLHRIKCKEKQEPVTLSYIRFQLEKLKALGYLPEGWEKAVEQILAQTSFSNELVLCHNDLAFNILHENGRLWVIDWECAGWNDPLFDLAPLCIWHHFTREEKQKLLIAYYGNLKQEKELEQAIKVVLIFSALWSQLEVAYGKDSYQKQAKDLFERVTNSVN